MGGEIGKGRWTDRNEALLRLCRVLLSVENVTLSRGTSSYKEIFEEAGVGETVIAVRVGGLSH